MKKAICLVCFALVILSIYCTDKSNSPNNENVDPSIVLWFPFDDTIQDIAKNDVPSMTIHGIALAPDRKNQQRKAAYFSGDTSRIDLPYKSAYNLHAMSICAWVYLEQSSIDQKIIALNLNNTISDSYNLGIYSNNKVEFWIYDASGWHGVRSITGGTVLQQNQWYLIAGIYDGDTLRTYVNGVLDRKIGLGNVSISYNTTDTVYIGYSPTGHYFKGKIDDLRVYNRAISEAELLEISN